MEISATEFKIHCLDLLDQVQKSGQVLRITKRGKVVAELHPPTNLAPSQSTGYGLLASVGKIHGDIIAPLDDVEWENLSEVSAYARSPRVHRSFVAEPSTPFDPGQGK